MRGERDDGYRLQAVRLLVRPDELRRLHTAHERHRHVHLRSKAKQAWHQSARAVHTGARTATHEDDVERPVALHARLERVDRELAVLRDLDLVAVLLEDLHRELLVDEVVLRNEDVG